jgi:hypothetical protein
VGIDTIASQALQLNRLSQSGQWLNAGTRLPLTIEAAVTLAIVGTVTPRAVNALV